MAGLIKKSEVQIRISFKISVIHSNEEAVRYWGMEFRKRVWTKYTSYRL